MGIFRDAPRKVSALRKVHLLFVQHRILFHGNIRFISVWRVHCKAMMVLAKLFCYTGTKPSLLFVIEFPNLVAYDLQSELREKLVIFSK